MSKIRFICCDCRDYMRTVPDKYFSLAIVDPPYFNGPQKLGFYGGRCSKTGVIRHGYKKIGKWECPGQDYFDELFRISEHQIIWGINYFQIANPGSGRIVWDKLNNASTFSDCEIAYCSMIDHVRKFTFMWNGMCQGKSHQEGEIMQGNKKLNEKRVHPTQKPVALYKWLLMNFWRGGVVFDSHLGGGSIAIACEDMGIDMVACEVEYEYIELSDKRLTEFRMQPKLI